MRCTACVAELILMNVVPDATMVRGFEHYGFFCSACHLAALRVFSRHGEDDSRPLPIHEAPPTVPASKVQEERIAAPGLFGRVIAKMRGQ